MTFQWLFSNIAWHFIQTSTLNAILAIKILPKVAKEMVTERPQPPSTLPILSLFWQLLEVWFHPDPLPPLVTMSLNMTCFFLEFVPYFLYQRNIIFLTAKKQFNKQQSDVSVCGYFLKFFFWKVHQNTIDKYKVKVDNQNHRIQVNSQHKKYMLTTILHDVKVLYYFLIIQSL